MIRFSQYHYKGNVNKYLDDAIASQNLAGGGKYTRASEDWLKQHTGCKEALLTTSCTDALELAVLLCDIGVGDEVILPSYTFVSTANALVLRGAKPVFVDIRKDTLNIDETLIEKAITPRTKAIIPVHYAGVSCDMQTIMDIATRYKLWVIEDAAQAILAKYNDRPVGIQGHLAAFSFHNTKNISAGEGGALLINEPEFISRGHILLDKGTNRKQFFEKKVDKYNWVDIGSSFCPGELISAVLYSQLEIAEQLIAKRMHNWNAYFEGLEKLEQQKVLRRPQIPQNCVHNGHIFYIILADQIDRSHFMQHLLNNGVESTFHYVPLHSSPAGRRFGITPMKLDVTNNMSKQIVRLPMSNERLDTEHVISAINSFFCHN